VYLLLQLLLLFVSFLAVLEIRHDRKPLLFAMGSPGENVANSEGIETCEGIGIGDAQLFRWEESLVPPINRQGLLLQLTSRAIAKPDLKKEIEKLKTGHWTRIYSRRWKYRKPSLFSRTSRG
jgi:hypothetical protein